MAIINERKLSLGFYGVATKGVTVAGMTKAYATIKERDADGNSGMFAFVKDASGDKTVKSGFAIYYKKGSGWKKVFEEEAMDQDVAELVTIKWDKVVGGPTSDPKEIDAAVAQAHEHANKDTLDKISAKGDILQYNGKVIKAQPNKYTKWLQLIRPISTTENLHCRIEVYQDYAFRNILSSISTENDSSLFKYYDGNEFTDIPHSGVPDTSAGRFVIADLEDKIGDEPLYIKWAWYRKNTPDEPVSKGVCVYPAITPTSTESVGLVDVNNTISWNTN